MDFRTLSFSQSAPGASIRDRGQMHACAAGTSVLSVPPAVN